MGAGPAKRFGSYFWSSGPLMLGSATLAKKATSRESALLKALNRVVNHEKTVVKKVLGEESPLFGRNAPSSWHQGKAGGVLARLETHAPRAEWDAMLALDPNHVPEGDWKLAVHRFVLAGDPKRFFIDPWSQDEHREAPKGTPVTLAAGEWEVDHAQLVHKGVPVDLYRFRPKGSMVAVAKPKGTLEAAKPELVLTAEAKKAGKKLTFVETDGGPVLLAPVALLKDWNGVYDADGEYIYEQEACDYDRACDSKKYVLRVGPGEALVLGQDPVAFFLRDAKTAFLLSWIGADDKSHVLQAALSASEKSFKSTKEIFTLRSKTGVALFDSAARGADLEKRSPGALPAGRWAIDEMKEFDGELIDGEARHGLMTTALRLRKV